MDVRSMLTAPRDGRDLELAFYKNKSAQLDYYMAKCDQLRCFLQLANQMMKKRRLEKEALLLKLGH